ncbi:lipase family protein [Marimonas lutisalis]|uniref:lipase family protein n=1 Tax=Marimonas lutisalis TaxID=2545756 RepID=UPI0010F59035|nr:hypothetical protein [Marimonas lutisalis]
MARFTFLQPGDNMDIWSLYEDLRNPDTSIRPYYSATNAGFYIGFSGYAAPSTTFSVGEADVVISDWYLRGTGSTNDGVDTYSYSGTIDSVTLGQTFQVEPIAPVEFATTTSGEIVGYNTDLHWDGQNAYDEFIGSSGDDVIYGELGWWRWGWPVTLGGMGVYGEYVTSTRVVGDDLIEAGDGNDTISAGYGTDTIDGGDGFDVYNAWFQKLDGAAPSRAPGDFDWVEREFAFPEQQGVHINLGAATDIRAVANEASDNLNFSELEVIWTQLSIHTSLEAESVIDSLQLEGESPDAISNVESVWGSPYADIIITVGETEASSWAGQGGLAYGQDGDDVIVMTEGTAFASGGLGRDLILGRSGNDLANGDEGDDYLYGGAGDDTLWGGAGTDLLDGGEGFDWYNTYSSTVDISVNLSTSDFTLSTFDEFDRLMQFIDASGSPERFLPHSETLLAETAYDIFDTQDTVRNFEGIEGRDTFDFFIGSSNGGTLRGRGGEDILIAAGGTNTLSGGTGRDFIVGHEDTDTIEGGENDDYLFGRGGDDSIHGNEGNDFISSGTGSDFIDGGEIADDGSYEDLDTVLLPGQRWHYTVFDDADANTAVFINRISGDSVTLRNIEKVEFEGEFERQSNTVENYVVEAAKASLGSYSPLFLGAANPLWSPIHAHQLGMPLRSDPGAPLTEVWTFQNGIFRAPINRMAVAHVGETVMNGEHTLLIAFTGTDEIGDATDGWLTPRIYWDYFAPLITGLRSYIEDSINGVQKLFVTGHSLGGAMAQLFAEEFSQHNNMQVITFGSPGTSTNLGQDSRILHIEHGQDDVALVGSAGGSLLGFEKPGARVIVPMNDLKTNSDDNLVPVYEHKMELYLKSVSSLEFAEPALSFMSSSSYFAGTESRVAAGTNGNDSFGGEFDYDIGGLPFDEILYGLSGDDSILGFAGNDTLFGGPDQDTLEGGPGKDVLSGGDGADTFKYSSVGESGPGLLERDVITDFNRSEDIIDLQKVDANSTFFSLGNQSFAFLGTGSFMGNPGELRLETSAGLVVQADTNGDRSPDMEIVVQGETQLDLSNFLGVGALLNGDDGDNPIYGGAANEIINGFGGHDTLSGDLGSDTIDGGSGNDSLEGGSGNDEITDGAGNDTVLGGSGDDTLVGTTGVDTFEGGDGNDLLTADLRDASNPQGATILVDLATGRQGASIQDASEFDTLISIENYQFFGDFDVELVGNVAANLLQTDTGNDTLDGGAGNDTLLAGDGNDSLLGGDGDDDIADGAGNDSIFGGAGNDTLRVSTGLDTYNGGDGIDLLAADLTGASNTQAPTILVDLAAGRQGASIQDPSDFDTLISIENYQFLGDFDVELVGNDSANLLQTDTGNDTLDGGVGNDTLLAGDGDDSLTGGGGNDTLYGGVGDDSMFGGNGDDLLRLGNGQESIDGGADNDTLEVDLTGATSFSFLPFINLATGQVGATDIVVPLDTVVNVENVVFIGNFHVELTGDGIGNYLQGGAGDDTIDGGAGDDTLMGDTGADQLTGGDGFDIISYAGATQRARVDFLNDVAGNGRAAAGDLFTELDPGRVVDVEGVIGTDFDDLLMTDLSDNSLDGGLGDDVLRGRKGRDTMTGGDGNDELDGGKGRDRMEAGDGDDTLIGRRGLDNMRGGTGNDTLDGGTSNDILVGGRGNDVLIGGDDNDTIQGNQGDDVFVFADGHGVDIVLDFEATNDNEKLDFSGLSTMNSFADVEAAATQQGNDVLIITGGSSSILLQGVSLSDLGAVDFIF